MSSVITEIEINKSDLVIKYDEGNDNGLNGLFYTNEFIQYLDVPNMKIPTSKKKFTVCGFTMPEPKFNNSWLNYEALSWSTFPENNKNISGSLCFGGSESSLEDWIPFYNGLTTNTEITNFVNHYFSNKNGWNNWDTLMLDMEAKDAINNDPYNNLKSEINVTLPLLYKELKRKNKSLYLVVLPKEYKNYINKMDVDGIISMNYNGDNAEAYNESFSALYKDSKNMIIPALNPMYQTGETSKAEPVTEYLKQGFNIETGCMLWASSASCSCSTNFLINYIDNFNNNINNDDICIIKSDNTGPCNPSDNNGKYIVKEGDSCYDISIDLCGPGYGGINYYKSLFCEDVTCNNLKIKSEISYDCSGTKKNCN